MMILGTTIVVRIQKLENNEKEEKVELENRTGFKTTRSFTDDFNIQKPTTKWVVYESNRRKTKGTWSRKE